MNASRLLTIMAAVLLICFGADALAGGFAGLGSDARGFAEVVPGKSLVFPEDFGAHPKFRIEWWYLTANLMDESGASYGVQWTLFRRAMEPGPERARWSNQNIWMGHAAVTSSAEHLFSETFARGGIGQAGVAVAPFRAWIDDWSFASRDASPEAGLSRADGCRQWAKLPLHPQPHIQHASRSARRARLQPQVGAWTGILLLQPTLFHGGRRPYLARPEDAGLGAGLDGPGVEQSAIGVRPKGVGLVLTSPCKWREGDAFSPEERENARFFCRDLDRC